MAVQIVLLVVVIIVLVVLARSLRVAAEWQRAVILRLGRFHKTKGPGVYLVFPVIDRVAQTVDLRIQTTTITAEQANAKLAFTGRLLWQEERLRPFRPRRAGV